MTSVMSPRGHELISEYYDAAQRAHNRGADAIATKQLREAFDALEAYIIYLESGGE